MRRIRLIIEYDGTAYAGWQRQINAMSVQQKIEEALLRLTGDAIVLTGASRTDAGVHALGQNAHFDTFSRIPGEKFCYALNTMLPEDIRVRESAEAAVDFHARFSAKGKLYRYQIHNHPHAGALTRNTHAHVIYPLDVDTMRKEAAAAIGTHDFAPFAASGSVVKDTVRTIESITLERTGDEIVLYVKGNGFLYNMVRILAGTLIGVGSGKLEPGAIARALSGGGRLDLGITAPARGLTLMAVYYGDAGANMPGAIRSIKRNLDDARVYEVLGLSQYRPTEEKLRALADSYARDEAVDVYGWFEKERLEGMIAVRRMPGDGDCEILSIAVDPSRQRAGIGAKLVAHAAARARGARLFAETDDDAVGFYRKAGFAVASLGEKYPGIVRYRCTLEKMAGDAGQMPNG